MNTMKAQKACNASGGLARDTVTFVTVVVTCVHHDLCVMAERLTRSGVWRGGGNPLLPGDNLRCRHVHHRCCGNRSGRFNVQYAKYSSTWGQPSLPPCTSSVLWKSLW
jgi:hypothetical protein